MRSGSGWAGGMQHAACRGQPIACSAAFPVPSYPAAPPTQVDHVRAERNVLAEVRHHSIVGLRYSFQDEEYLYLVMEYLPGGDMMTLLIRKEILPEPWARFYLAQVRWCGGGGGCVSGACGGPMWGRGASTACLLPACCLPARLPARLLAAPTPTPCQPVPLCPAADRDCAGGDPRGRLHPPRHQARQPAAGCRGAHEVVRLWPLQASGRLHPARLCGGRGARGGGGCRAAPIPQPPLPGRAAAALAGGLQGGRQWGLW